MKEGSCICPMDYWIRRSSVLSSELHCSLVSLPSFFKVLHVERLNGKLPFLKSHRVECRSSWLLIEPQLVEPQLVSSQGPIAGPSDGPSDPDVCQRLKKVDVQGAILKNHLRSFELLSLSTDYPQGCVNDCSLDARVASGSFSENPHINESFLLRSSSLDGRKSRCQGSAFSDGLTFIRHSQSFLSRSPNVGKYAWFIFKIRFLDHSQFVDVEEEPASSFFPVFRRGGSVEIPYGIKIRPLGVYRLMDPKVLLGVKIDAFRNTHGLP